MAEPDWLRLPAFLYTGFALVMPPFVSYAQGFEVIQPERLPRQAKAWKLLADRLSPLDLGELPPTPEHLRTLTRPPPKGQGHGQGRRVAYRWTIIPQAPPFSRVPSSRVRSQRRASPFFSFRRLKVPAANSMKFRAGTVPP